MSPNNKPTITKDDDAQDLDYSQFSHQTFHVQIEQTDEDDNQQNLDSGYVLLNQDLEHELDYSDTDTYTDSESSDDQCRVVSNFSQISNSNVNVIKLDNEDDGQDNIDEDDGQDDIDENDDQDNPRLKSYLNNNQLPSEEMQNFEREWDKKETVESDLNPITLNEDNVDKIKECMKNITLPACSMPEWANEIEESNLTNFIYKRLTSK